MVCFKFRTRGQEGGVSDSKFPKTASHQAAPLSGVSHGALPISNKRLLQTSVRLSGPSAYTNEKVLLLLTKMDLTEFRS